MLGVQETHLRGQRVPECMRGDECKVLEGMEGGVGRRLDVGNEGRGEGCTLLISTKVWEGLGGTSVEGIHISWDTWNNKKNEV